MPDGLRVPIVSVVLAVRNEGGFVEKAVRSLLAQETDGFDLEVLVVDGDSTDGTTEIVQRLASADDRIRWLPNRHRKTPHAFNIGIGAARGEYVAIFGAHTEYDPDYIATCMREMEFHGAAACSGQIVTCPANDSVQARLVAWALQHPFGSSRSSVRTQQEGFVDTLPYPVFRREALIQVGGYDEQLHRNQDNDMNQRLRERGYKLYLTARTKARYFVKPTVPALARYAYHSGFWNYMSLRKNPASMAPRHFAPFLFTTYLVATAILATFGVVQHDARWSVPLVAAVGMHLLLGLGAALQVCLRQRNLVPLCLPAVFFILHFSYGAGTLAALLRNARCEQAAVVVES